jgi:hypothetical protein
MYGYKGIEHTIPHIVLYNKRRILSRSTNQEGTTKKHVKQGPTAFASHMASP